MIGERFGRLTVMRESEPYVSPGGRVRPRWLCLCDCGIEKVIVVGSLKSGLTKSCGCLVKENTVKRNTTHGNTSHHLWSVYKGMIQRCTNEKSPNFKYYGGRGITVDPEWVQSFESFVDHIGNRPTLEHSIDRIKNESGYEPGNVRWATKSQQVWNRGLDSRNKTGMSGVFYREDRNKYEVYLSNEYIGSYDTIEKAKLIRSEHEQSILR